MQCGKMWKCLKRVYYCKVLLASAVLKLTLLKLSFMEVMGLITMPCRKGWDLSQTLVFEKVGTYIIQSIGTDTKQSLYIMTNPKPSFMEVLGIIPKSCFWKSWDLSQTLVLE